MSSKNLNISSHQSLMLIFSSALGNIFIVFPKVVIDDIGRDAWLTVLISYGLGMLFSLIIFKVGSYFPNKTFVQYLPNILGSILGKMAGLFFLISFLLLSSWVFRENTEIMSAFMPETPPLVFTLLMGLLFVYLLFAGFEVYVRTTEFLIPIMFFFIALIFLFALPIINFNELSPVLEKGFLPIAKNVPVPFAFALEPVLFTGMWLPYVNQHGQAKKSLIIGFAVSGLIISLLVMIIITTLTPPLVASTLFPLLIVSRVISMPDFLPNVDVLFIILWIISSFVQIMIFLTSVVYGLSQWFHLKIHKLIIFPVIIISIVLSMFPKDITDVQTLEYLTAIYGKLPIGFLILISPLLVKVRRLKGS